MHSKQGAGSIARRLVRGGQDFAPAVQRKIDLCIQEEEWESALKWSRVYEKLAGLLLAATRH